MATLLTSLPALVKTSNAPVRYSASSFPVHPGHEDAQLTFPWGRSSSSPGGVSSSLVPLQPRPSSLSLQAAAELGCGRLRLASSSWSRATRAFCALPCLALLPAARRQSRATSSAAQPPRKRIARLVAVAEITRPDATPEAKRFCKKGARVEVLAPSNRWREAKVVKRHPDSATVHYDGYDKQFDERVFFDSGRLRPFGALRNQERKERKDSFSPEEKLHSCPGCGIALQCSNPKALGYVPPEKMKTMEEEEPTLDGMALTLEDEVKLLLGEDGAQEDPTTLYPTKCKQTKFRVAANVYLDIRKEPDIDSELQGESLKFGDTFDICEIFRSSDRTYFRLADGRGWVFDWATVNGYRMQLMTPVEDVAEEMRRQKNNRQIVCQRCWSLWQYNDCDEIYRPGFGEQAHDELGADKFEEMLRKTLAPVQRACVLAVVDLFDFGPSKQLLQYLAKQLERKKYVRVRIVANKLDLLPKEVNLARIKGWISREAQDAGLQRVLLNDIFPASCHKKQGMKAINNLLDVKDAPQEFYIVGAANAGKSSLLNRMMLQKRKGPGQIAARAASGFLVSPLPGTTMRPLTVKYQRGKIKIVDTPGLLVHGSLTERLSFEDVKAVLPQTSESRRVTLHVKEGFAVLLGALAQVELVQGRPFQFTVFTSERVKLHRTRVEKVPDYLERFAGDRLTPPMTRERFQALKPWVEHEFDLKGTGWDEACVDIVFDGLGWVSITGCGRFLVKAQAPEGVNVTLREPLMPFEAKWTGVKYKGAPGWFQVGKWTTRGNELGNVRRGLKGQKF